MRETPPLKSYDFSPPKPIPTFSHLTDSPPLTTLREVPAKPIRGQESGLGLLTGVFPALFLYHVVMGASAVGESAGIMEAFSWEEIIYK